MTYNIALELGTYNTAIYLEENGVVYYQPSCVAFVGEKRAHNVTAYGRAAKSLEGMTPEKTTVISPIRAGLIVDDEAAIHMLKAVLRDLLPSQMLTTHISALVLIPCGLTLEERKMFEEVCFRSGIREVTLIESIVAAGIGCDLPVSSGEGCFVVNIGGGTCEIAAIALCGIVHGISVEVGGNMMNRDIATHLLKKYQLEAGEQTIERLKSEIGSLFVNDTASLTVSGRDQGAKSPVSRVIFAKDILEAVLATYHAIAEAIESVLNLCPPEVSGNIFKSGVIVTGGGAKILGLEQLFTDTLKITTFVAPDPEYACIVGGGKLLSDPDLLRRVLEQN